MAPSSEHNWKHYPPINVYKLTHTRTLPHILRHSGYARLYVSTTPKTHAHNTCTPTNQKPADSFVSLHNVHQHTAVDVCLNSVQSASRLVCLCIYIYIYKYLPLWLRSYACACLFALFVCKCVWQSDGTAIAHHVCLLSCSVCQTCKQNEHQVGLWGSHSQRVIMKGMASTEGGGCF